jgi:phage FluMu protein Com
MSNPVSKLEAVSSDSSRFAAGTACEHEDLRCGCGSLLARIVGQGVELKCRRCKRTVVVPFQSEEGADVV